MRDIQKLYIIGPESGDMVKIGVAADPEGRRRELQTGNPHPLRVLYEADVANARRVESAAHRFLKEHRLCGEWFAIGFQAARDAVEKARHFDGSVRMKAPRASNDDWMVWDEGLAELEERLNDRSLGMQAVRVLMAMLNSAGYENLVEASQKDLSIRLGMSLSEISKASHALMACGMIERLANRRGWYRINPRLAWKGNVESLEQALAAKRAAA